MSERRRDRRSQEGSALIISLLMMVLLFGLGCALLATSEVEGVIASNEQWSEGAFFAAEAGVQIAIDRIRSQTDDTAPIAETEIGEGFFYRSGRRTDDTAQPIPIVGSVNGPGFSVAGGTGYNPSGFVFNVYQVNVTGQGPRDARREVEVQVEYGPAASAGM